MTQHVQIPGQGHNSAERLARLNETTSRLNLFEFWGVDPKDEHQATSRLRADRIPAIPYIWK